MREFGDKLECLRDHKVREQAAEISFDKGHPFRDELNVASCTTCVDQAAKEAGVQLSELGTICAKKYGRGAFMVRFASRSDMRSYQ